MAAEDVIADNITCVGLLLDCTYDVVTACLYAFFEHFCFDIFSISIFLYFNIRLHFFFPFLNFSIM